MPAIKQYSRINFESVPSHNTPLNAANLNKMDKGIDDLDDLLVTARNNIETLQSNATADEANILALQGEISDLTTVDNTVRVGTGYLNILGEHICILNLCSGETAQGVTINDTVIIPEKYRPSKYIWASVSINTNQNRTMSDRICIYPDGSLHPQLNGGAVNNVEVRGQVMWVI